MQFQAVTEKIAAFAIGVLEVEPAVSAQQEAVVGSNEKKPAFKEGTSNWFMHSQRLLTILLNYISFFLYSKNP